MYMEKLSVRFFLRPPLSAVFFLLALFFGGIVERWWWFVVCCVCLAGSDPRTARFSHASPKHPDVSTRPVTREASTLRVDSEPTQLNARLGVDPRNGDGTRT